MDAKIGGDSPLGGVIKTHELEVVKAAVRAAIDREELAFRKDAVNVLAMYEQLGGRLVIELQAFVAGKEERVETSHHRVERPASWWQHFKQDSRLFRWACLGLAERYLARWPVRYTVQKLPEKTTRTWRVCPHYPLPLQPGGTLGLGPCVQFMVRTCEGRPDRDVPPVTVLSESLCHHLVGMSGPPGRPFALRLDRIDRDLPQVHLTKGQFAALAHAVVEEAERAGRQGGL